MWEVTINVIDVIQKRARITAVRTPVADEARYAYSCTAIINTAGQRSAVLDQIKDAYENYLLSLDMKEDVIAGLEATATNALNTWEGTL